MTNKSNYRTTPSWGQMGYSAAYGYVSWNGWNDTADAMVEEIALSRAQSSNVPEGKPTEIFIANFIRYINEHDPREQEQERATYGTIADAITDVETTLGEFAGDFDTEAIAREITEWVDGKLTANEKAEGEAFWEIVRAHDLTE